MRGPWRIRKKHLNIAGWEITEEDNGHRLLMQKPSNDDYCQTIIEAETHAAAYFIAEHTVLEPRLWLAS